MRSRKSWAALLACCMLSAAGCGYQRSVESPPRPEAPREPLERLSEYGLFAGDIAAQQPAEGVLPYDLNSPLFTDYAVKYRFVKLPAGTRAVYHETAAFGFPVGTIIAKTFAIPRDARDLSKGQRLIETRILKHEPDGWVGLPYIWNEAQNEATLELAGGTTDVRWVHTDGNTRTNNYIIPNANQCKGCHKQGETVTPIGPSARQLNRDFAYASGTENQLFHWTRIEALAGAPAPEQAPRLAVWDDPSTGTLDARARAWLEINCAHCHNPEGPARNSGLDLTTAQTNPTAYGILKVPVAAGRGSGGRDYDIVPGQPDRSILVFRINSTDAGIMMPELGKRLIHDEGLKLIREWIAAMPDQGQPGRSRGTASSSMEATRPAGPLDGKWFETDSASLWRGRPGEPSWWWQVAFPEPRPIGSIVQVHGDHDFALRNAPADYVWQVSQDGKTWEDLRETATRGERRMIRVHRLNAPRTARWARLAISAANGESPALREVSFHAEPAAKIALPPWAVVVSTTGSREVPGEGAAAFRGLARSCKGWEQLPFQNVWLGDFDPAFLAVEPAPLCAFLSGNFIDWCQQKRDHWKGTAAVLREGTTPLWASCGGAQGLAILAETGVDQLWDCPQCRDPAHPKLPIYTHIAGSTRRACGDYSGCVFERGAYPIRRVLADPVFQGLPAEFPAMESHCGQIEWAPRGWELIATHGAGGKTRTQCLRLKDHPIYAAQFHIEMQGTPETSRTIMANFLNLALRAGQDRLH